MLQLHITVRGFFRELLLIIFFCLSLPHFSFADFELKNFEEIYSGQNGFSGVIDSQDGFGYSIANIGDLDSDGIEDLAVGTPGDDGITANEYRGAVWILFMNNDGTVKSTQKISDTEGNFSNVLNDHDSFGQSLTSLGDIDGDGLTDIAVGSHIVDGLRGKVWILFLNSDGTVKNHSTIANGIGGLGFVLDANDQFAYSLGSSDIDNDGQIELLVGSRNDDDGRILNNNTTLDKGAVWVLELNSEGLVTERKKISDTQGNFTGVLSGRDKFGQSVTSIGDFDSDGVEDLAVGGEDSDASGILWILFMNSDKTVKVSKIIDSGMSGLSEDIYSPSRFGNSIALINDVNLDGTKELVVGAPGYGVPDSSSGAGAFFILSLDANANVESYKKFTKDNFNPESFVQGEFFGGSLSTLYDLDYEFAVGSPWRLNNGELRGAVFLINIGPSNNPPVLSPIGNQTVAEGENLSFTLSATDPDGDTLTYTASNLPSGATFDPQTQTFSWTPGYSDAGNYENIEFSVMDNGSPMEVDVELITITVGNVNRAPVIDPIGAQELLEEDTLTFTITASDPDTDTFALSATNLPTGATFNTTTGVFSFTPSLSQEGIYTVTFSATDTGTPTESGTTDVVITVGDNPTPVEQSEDIIEDVINLDIPNNVENAYMANLQKVATFIEQGKIQAAINQLQAFINKVNQDYAQNVLTQTERNVLIDAAEDLIADLD